MPGLKLIFPITSRRGLRRIMTDGKMGFCEAFMLGEAASANLPGLIELAVIQNDYVEDGLRFSWLKISSAAHPPPAPQQP